MKELPPLSEEAWGWLCEPIPARPAAVAAGVARLAGGDWPSPLAVADAILTQLPPTPSRLVRA